MALVVQNPEVVLRPGVTLLCRLAIPKRRLGVVVLPIAFTVCVQHPKIELRIGLALIRREVHRLHCYASALQVHKYLFKRLF